MILVSTWPYGYDLRSAIIDSALALKIHATPLQWQSDHSFSIEYALLFAEKTYVGSEIESLDLLDVATWMDYCNKTIYSLYNGVCGGVNDFQPLLDCLMSIEGPFKYLVQGSAATGYNMTLPASYDIRYTPFDTKTLEGRLHVFTTSAVIDASFYLNILITLRTKVSTLHGTFSSFKQIFSGYNKWNGLWLDLAGVFPFEGFSHSFGCTKVTANHNIAFLRLNRLTYFFRYVPAAFKRWEYNLNVRISRVRALKIVAYIFFLTHVCGCIFFWWSCGNLRQRHLERIQTKCLPRTWGWLYGISYNTTKQYDYLKTMYWASTTMTSTGYGDVVPVTGSSRVLAFMTMIVGTVMYGWLVAVIASTASNTGVAETTFRNSIIFTKRYLSLHAVPRSLINRVVNVRRIEWSRYKGTATPGKQCIGRELPEQLQCAMLYEIVNDLVEKLPFFQDMESSFISMLCNHVITYHYAEGDVIIYEGDLPRNLYIIKRGHCMSVTPNFKQITDRFRAGDYFGEVPMLFGCGSPYTIVASTACEVLVIQRSDIDEVLDSFPILQEQMRAVERNESYKQRVLNMLEVLNESNCEGNMSNDLYQICRLEGGLRFYGKKLSSTPLYNVLSKDERDLKATKNVFGRLLSFLLLPLTFNPLSTGFIIYQTIRAVLILITALFIPLHFSASSYRTELTALQYTLDALSLIDQYISAHVVYYSERNIAVTHSTRTAAHYLRTGFIYDLVSWFPWEYFISNALGSPLSLQQRRFVSLMRVNRLLQFSKIFSYFSFWHSDIRASRRWLKHLSSVIYAFLMHTICAFLFFIVACSPTVSNKDSVYSTSPQMVAFNTTTAGLSYCHETTWIGQSAKGNVFPALDLVNSVVDRYVISLYWSSVTLLCTGYGDIHARTQSEMFVSIVVMVMGTIFYSYLIGDISASIQTDDKRRGNYKSRLSDMMKFFRCCDIAEETQRQVLNYYRYLWERTEGVSPDNLLVGLPPSTRTSVYQSMYVRMLKEAFNVVGTKTDNDTEGFFRLVSSVIHPHLFVKDSVVYRRGDTAGEMYFVERGNVAIMDRNEKTPLMVLGPGQHFGEVALLFSTRRTRTVKAITNCDLNVIRKNDLDEILEKFPTFREQLNLVAKDRRTLGTSSTTFNRQPSAAALSRGSHYDVTDAKLDEEDTEQAFKALTTVLNYNSYFVSMWNHATLMLTVLSTSIVLYQLCFQNHHAALYIIGYIIDLWFTLDMVISYHTNFRDEFCTKVDDINAIHRDYYEKPHRFLLCAITNVPLGVLGHALSSNLNYQLLFFAYVRLNRVLRMLRLLDILHIWENDIRRNTLYYRMYKFLLCVAFISNAVACGWIATSCSNGVCRPYSWTTTSSTNYGARGLSSYNFLPWLDSLYWAVTTMTSTGYGDIKPETRLEMIYASFIVTLGKMLIGYVLGALAATVANDEYMKVWYEQSVKSVKCYMADLQFNKHLHDHVVQYYEYMWIKSHGIDTAKLFPELPSSLYSDIYTQMCKTMVDKIELFRGCSQSFIKQVCMSVKLIAFMPGDYICLEGDFRSEMYIIRRGFAEAVSRENGEEKPLRLVLEGEHFLCESVLCKVRRPCSLRARTYVDVFSLTMESLESVLDRHPKERPIILENARRLYENLDI